ncbi:ABC transporter B family member 4-like protein isoform X1 [Tanacetum coccineum]
MSVTIAKMASHGQYAYAKASIVVEQTIGSIRTVVSFTGEKKIVKEYNLVSCRCLIITSVSRGPGFLGRRSLGQASLCLSAFAAGQAAAYKMFETKNHKTKRKKNLKKKSE